CGVDKVGGHVGHSQAQKVFGDVGGGYILVRVDVYDLNLDPRLPLGGDAAARTGIAVVRVVHSSVESESVYPCRLITVVHSLWQITTAAVSVHISAEPVRGPVKPNAASTARQFGLAVGQAHPDPGLVAIARQVRDVVVCSLAQYRCLVVVRTDGSLDQLDRIFS